MMHIAGQAHHSLGTQAGGALPPVPAPPTPAAHAPARDAPAAAAPGQVLLPPGHAGRPAHRSVAGRLLLMSLAVLLGGIVLYVIVYQALVATGDPLFIPALIVVGASTVPAAFAVYLRHLTGPLRVSARTLGLSALWGGVLGAVVAGVLETDTVRVFGGIPTPLIGLIEESAKLLVPLGLVLFARRLRHSDNDGLLIGVAVGVGFAVLETMGYAFVVLVQSRGNLHVMDQLLLVRGLLAPAGHAAWTGLAAAALWRAGLRRTPRSLAAFGGTLALVVALHAAWDASTAWAWYAVLAGVSLTLLHLRLWWARRAAGSDPAGRPAAVPGSPWPPVAPQPPSAPVAWYPWNPPYSSTPPGAPVPQPARLDTPARTAWPSAAPPAPPASC